jgi:hypothetical protein
MADPKKTVRTVTKVTPKATFTKRFVGTEEDALDLLEAIYRSGVKAEAKAEQQNQATSSGEGSA